MAGDQIIAVDAMSGDRGPAVAVDAVREILARRRHLEVALVGRPDDIAPRLDVLPAAIADRIRFFPASEVVGMDEPPADALRHKKDSSMRVAIDLVSAGDAQACVSAGNTGALMATARFVLKTLPGIDRPAILSAIPALGGHTLMLDLGANTDCTAAQLCQFGIMGSVAASAIQGTEDPRVGLLNIGAEAIKGTDTIREAAALLERASVNYVGFVEGNDIFSGSVDVVVTDGFTGNVALKTMEGLARLIGRIMGAEFRRGPRARAAGVLARPVLDRVRGSLDPRRYNGASLVGLRGIVIKSHGSADSLAMASALDTALLEIRRDLPGRIGARIETDERQRGTA